MLDHEDENWCWTLDLEDTPHGPFPSREAAIANARFIAEQGFISAEEVTVGRMGVAPPAHYASSAVRADDILEEMCDACSEDAPEPASERTIFEFADDEAAQKDLERVVGQWARNHIKANIWIVVGAEQVSLEDDDDD